MEYNQFLIKLGILLPRPVLKKKPNRLNSLREKKQNKKERKRESSPVNTVIPLA